MKPVRVFAVFACMLFVFLSPLPAIAAVTYTYTGNNFTDFTNTSQEGQLFTTSDQLSLTMTFSDYLDSGGVFQDIDTEPTFWQMTAGTVTFGSNYGDVLGLGLAVTGPSVPASWAISGTRLSDTGSNFTTYGGQLAPTDPIDQVNIVYPYFEEGSQDTYATNSAMVYDSPGIWSVSSEPVPIPSALPLFGSGLVALGLLHRRMSGYWKQVTSRGNNTN